MRGGNGDSLSCLPERTKMHAKTLQQGRRGSQSWGIRAPCGSVAHQRFRDDRDWPDGKIIESAMPMRRPCKSLRILSPRCIAGAGLKDVIRTRIFVTNIPSGKKSARRMEEFLERFGLRRSMVEVSG